MAPGLFRIALIVGGDRACPRAGEGSVGLVDRRGGIPSSDGRSPATVPWVNTPPAGYSGTPLPRKLGIRDEQVVFVDNLPEDVELGDLGAATVFRRLPRQADLTVTFHTSYAALARRLPVLFERTSTAGMVWICWPKKSAQKALLEASPDLVVDLTDAQVRELGLSLGFVDVKVAAVDDTWSALKFVRRLRDRSG
jgi:hypothetical protein